MNNVPFLIQKNGPLPALLSHIRPAVVGRPTDNVSWRPALAIGSPRLVFGLLFLQRRRSSVDPKRNTLDSDIPFVRYYQLSLTGLWLKIVIKFRTLLRRYQSWVLGFLTALPPYLLKSTHIFYDFFQWNNNFQPLAAAAIFHWVPLFCRVQISLGAPTPLSCRFFYTHLES